MGLAPFQNTSALLMCQSAIAAGCWWNVRPLSWPLYTDLYTDRNVDDTGGWLLQACQILDWVLLLLSALNRDVSAAVPTCWQSSRVLKSTAKSVHFILQILPSFHDGGWCAWKKNPCFYREQMKKNSTLWQDLKVRNQPTIINNNFKKY